LINAFNNSINLCFYNMDEQEALIDCFGEEVERVEKVERVE
jgi:hypothetical protein